MKFVQSSSLVSIVSLQVGKFDLFSSYKDGSVNSSSHKIPCISSIPYIQFSSVAQSCLTLCNPMNHRKPGLLVHHQLPQFTQTHIHRVGDVIQPSHPLSSPSPPAPNTDFIFWGSRITADGDCSHEIKRAYSLEGKL